MIEEFLSSSSIKWTPIELNRGDYLIKKGVVERFIYFVKTGAVRACLLTDEEEFTIRFGYRGSIITSITSYFSGEPSDIYIQAIRKTSLLRTTKTDFEAFVNSDMTLLQKYQEVLKELVVSFMEREVDLLTKDPAERLSIILERSPQLFQEVPHKYIASYLRMSPETLSRLLKS